MASINGQPLLRLRAQGFLFVFFNRLTAVAVGLLADVASSNIFSVGR